MIIVIFIRGITLFVNKNSRTYKYLIFTLQQQNYESLSLNYFWRRETTILFFRKKKILWYWIFFLETTIFLISIERVQSDVTYFILVSFEVNEAEIHKQRYFEKTRSFFFIGIIFLFFFYRWKKKKRPVVITMKNCLNRKGNSPNWSKCELKRQ